MSSIGWNGADLWVFEQLMIKANDEQLKVAGRRIRFELDARFERSARRGVYREVA